VSATLRFATGSLRCSVQPGSKTTRLRLKQVFALIRLALRSSAHTQGVRKEYQTAEDKKNEYLKKQGHATACPCLYLSSLSLVFGSRSRLPRPGWAEERRDKRIRAKTCLSRRRVVFDPAWLEHRRLPVAKRRDPDCGSPFLLLTFLLAKQKKSELPPGNPRPAGLREERPARTGPGLDPSPVF
jgi:hypothetical protein